MSGRDVLNALEKRRKKTYSLCTGGRWCASRRSSYTGSRCRTWDPWNKKKVGKGGVSTHKKLVLFFLGKAAAKCLNLIHLRSSFFLSSRSPVAAPFSLFLSKLLFLLLLLLLLLLRNEPHAHFFVSSSRARGEEKREGYEPMLIYQRLSWKERLGEDGREDRGGGGGIEHVTH